ncbi:MAG: hypothetical protein ACXVZQ_08210 [Terriglobales bacterium]
MYYDTVYSMRRITSRNSQPLTRLALPVVIVALIWVATAQAQFQNTRFDPIFENRQVSVFALNLPHGGHASIFQNTHDIFWIALAAAHVTVIDADGNKTAVAFAMGDTRFFPSFTTRSISNDAADSFRAVLVEIKLRGLASACDCDSGAQRSVCGCPRAAPLPPMWAVGIGQIVAGGTTLAPGESFRSIGERADTLLVAVSHLTLVDDAQPSSSVTIELRPGNVLWLPAGPHKLRNLGATPARYVTLEF